MIKSDNTELTCKIDTISADIRTDTPMLGSDILTEDATVCSSLSYAVLQNAGVEDVLVNGESVVDEEGIARITTKDIDTKIATLQTQMSIITPKVDKLSIVVHKHAEQLSVLENEMSLLKNKINEVDLRLSDTKLDKNLSILPDASPNLSIESRENLLVYLYNTQNETACKAKLTEIGYWDINN